MGAELMMDGSGRRLATPRAETTLDIQRRALEICPSFAFPPGSTEAVEISTLVKKEIVGFRPTRDAGVRLEKDAQVGGMPVVHNCACCLSPSDLGH